MKNRYNFTQILIIVKKSNYYNTNQNLSHIFLLYRIFPIIRIKSQK